MAVRRDNLLYVALANQLMQRKSRSTRACASTANNLKQEKAAHLHKILHCGTAVPG